MERLGRQVAERLERPSPGFRPCAYGARRCGPATCCWFRAAIKYLTRWTWTHSARRVGDALGDGGDDPRCLVEAPADPAGAGPAPPPHAGDGRRPPDPGDLLLADRDGFEAVRYPVLPKITRELRHEREGQFQRREINRRHALYDPRNFDLSPISR